MASTGSTPALDLFQRQFDDVQKKFKQELSDAKCDPKILQEIFRVKNKNDVLLALEQLQEKQKTRGTWMHLERISPWIDGLQRYVAVINLYVQVKPDILALIWGPISLVLLWTSEVRAAFNTFIDVTMSLGQRLPQFEDVAAIFSDKDRIKSFLSLIYKDILEFYLTALKYFSGRKWKMLLGATWTSQKEKFQKIEEQIGTHLDLLRDETTFQHIQQAHVDALESMKRFDKLAAGQNQQLFQSLQIEMRPRNFATTLDWLRCRAVEGTGTWLMENETFAQSLVFNGQSPKHIWIQGIPGAGKTFLAYWIVTEAQKLTSSKTAYLFASHRDSDTTALSLIHSLIFQLAADDTDLQIALINSDNKDWKVNTFTATDTLQGVAKAIGRLFVIIDGLDEVDDSEREIFLQQILKVSGVCPKLKLYVCSRPERDIDKILGHKAVSISVNKSNSKSIKAYTQKRYTGWMQETNFTKAAQLEISALFSLIAARSEGMFLYARVVIDNVVSLNDIEEIIAELNSLPKDLTEAYSRIFHRINDLPQSRCRRVRRILSWVQCTPVAITIHEIEQGLLVNVDRSDAPSVESSIDVVGECGPIVEIINDQLQFVHFSVKEYLLNHSSETCIDPTQAAFDLLSTCLTYLSYSDFSEISDDHILRNIAQGKYRFARFAYSYWISLMQHCIGLSRNPDDITKLAYILENFFDLRGNSSSEPYIEEHGKYLPALNEFPELQQYFGQALSFDTDIRRDCWRLKTEASDDSWANHDPTIISRCMIRIETEYKKLYCKRFCEDKKIAPADLERHFGKHLFKCHFLSCPGFRIGFETQDNWTKHIQLHDRPFKCTFTECLYAALGFPSQSQLRQHMHMHTPIGSIPETDIDLPQEQELILVLFELVENDKVQEMQRIWPSCKGIIHPSIVLELMIRAAERGCQPIVQLMFTYKPICNINEHNNSHCTKERQTCKWDFCPGSSWYHHEQRLGYLFTGGINSGNLALEDWLLNITLQWWDDDCGDIKIPNPHVLYHLVIAAVMSSQSLRTLKLWKTKVQNTSLYVRSRILMAVFKPIVLKVAKRNTIYENELCGLVRDLLRKHQPFRHPTFGEMLRDIAHHCQSIQLAQCLLDVGVQVNFPFNHYPKRTRKGNTPLVIASAHKTREAAEFMKFLLANGADPDIRYRSRKPSDAAQNISRWLDIDWSNLLEWAKKEQDGLIQLGGVRGQQIQEWRRSR